MADPLFRLVGRRRFLDSLPYERVHVPQHVRYYSTNTVVALEAACEVSVDATLRCSQAKVNPVMGQLGIEYEEE